MAVKGEIVHFTSKQTSLSEVINIVKGKYIELLNGKNKINFIIKMHKPDIEFRILKMKSGLR